MPALWLVSVIWTGLAVAVWLVAAGGVVRVTAAAVVFRFAARLAAILAVAVTGEAFGFLLAERLQGFFAGRHNVGQEDR